MLNICTVRKESIPSATLVYLISFIVKISINLCTTSTMPKYFVCQKRNASFRFPRDHQTCELWLSSLGLLASKAPGPKARLCTQHFLPSQLKVTVGGRWRLLPGAVPTNQQDNQRQISVRVPVIQQVPDENHGQPSHEVQLPEDIAKDREEDKDAEESSSEDRLLSSLILIAGTLFLCFISFLLYWLSSRKSSKSSSDEGKKPEYAGWFTPVEEAGAYISAVILNI